MSDFIVCYDLLQKHGVLKSGGGECKDFGFYDFNTLFFPHSVISRKNVNFNILLKRDHNTPVISSFLRNHSRNHPVII